MSALINFPLLTAPSNDVIYGIISIIHILKNPSMIISYFHLLLMIRLVQHYFSLLFEHVSNIRYLTLFSYSNLAPFHMELFQFIHNYLLFL